MREHSTTDKWDVLLAEPLDWKRLGLKRPYDMSKRLANLLPPEETNTQKLGIALSLNTLADIDRMAKVYFPKKKNRRSAMIRLLIEAGIGKIEEERRAADQDNVVQRDSEERSDPGV